MFDDLITANAHYQTHFHDSGVSGGAARGLAVLTCIDSRIDPLAMLGLRPGDAKIIRNAGARASDDAIRSLVLATNLLGVDRICVVGHTDCAMVGSTDAEVAARISASTGRDASSMPFLAIEDQAATLADDVARIEACPLIPDTVTTQAFVFDVRTGALTALL